MSTETYRTTFAEQRCPAEIIEQVPLLHLLKRSCCPSFQRRRDLGESKWQLTSSAESGTYRTRSRSRS